MSEGCFDHFQAQKTVFLHFLAVVQTMFRHCVVPQKGKLSIYFELKRHTRKILEPQADPIFWGPTLAL